METVLTVEALVTGGQKHWFCWGRGCGSCRRDRRCHWHRRGRGRSRECYGRQRVQALTAPAFRSPRRS